MQLKGRPLKVCITWKVVGFLEFYIFPDLKKHQRASSNPVYHQHFYMVVHSFVFSKNIFH